MKKTVMSKVMGVAMSTIMAAAMLAGCGSASTTASEETTQTVQESTTSSQSDDNGTVVNKDDKVYKVGIIQHIDHPSLNQINAKIQETLQPLVNEGKVEIE